MSSEFDLVIRAGTVATAADTMRCDVGVVDGKVVALGERLAGGRDEIDAAGKLVLPGGVDAHCHLDQPIPPPMKIFFTPFLRMVLARSLNMDCTRSCASG